MDEVFRALADGSRRELLDRLRADNGQTLGDLCERLNMTRQAVSKHLGILEEANLIATVKRGREKLHYLNPVPIHEIGERWIGKFERSRLQAYNPSSQDQLHQKVREGRDGRLVGTSYGSLSLGGADLCVTSRPLRNEKNKANHDR